eukprot:TRINITY_DN9921_c0_g1_i1.p1 TRINITY_DN9921_c0_g1~~TRINITY_DN9921_c0_g1_i1.p1  ORF type:complete len:288 (+),score=28.19 TRINITY_DN9921_c0_g1_i1:211-1074(+)
METDRSSSSEDLPLRPQTNNTGPAVSGQMTRQLSYSLCGFIFNLITTAAILGCHLTILILTHDAGKQCTRLWNYLLVSTIVTFAIFFVSLVLVYIPNFLFYRHLTVEELQEKAHIKTDRFLQGLLKNFALVWWIVGTVWLGQDWTACKAESTLLLRYTAFCILFGWAGIAFVCCCTCFCTIFGALFAPCLLRLLRISRVIENRPPALSVEQIDKIAPAFAYQPEKENPTGEELSCAVCMDNFQANDMVRKLSCKHIYHDKCVSQWLEINSTCPMCRATVTEASTSEV